jgi:ribosomal protein S18 acetylase RimI-like enzyme
MTNKTENIYIIHAENRKDVEIAKNLFIEYAHSLNFDLCFQDFDKELSEMPGNYAQPEGRLLLALVNGLPAGCCALRKLEEGICEMKRLYVKPEFRNLKIGKLLAEKIIEEAKTIGYKKMRLDTVPSMERAISLYTLLGFKETIPYRYNPQPGVKYMELQLN